MEFKKLKKIGTENDKNRLNQLCNEKNLTKEDLILIIGNIDIEKINISIGTPDWRIQDVAIKTVEAILSEDLEYSESTLDCLFKVLKRSLRKG